MKLLLERLVKYHARVVVLSSLVTTQTRYCGSYNHELVELAKRYADALWKEES